MKPGRELDALISEKIFNIPIGWKKFYYWHPGCQTEHHDTPNWSITKFEGVGDKEDVYTPRNIRGEMLKSIFADDYQTFGYLENGLLCPHYSTDIKCAFDIIHKSGNFHWQLERSMDWRNDGKNPPDQMPEDTGCNTYFVWEYKATPGTAMVKDANPGISYESMAHAICLAALKEKHTIK